MPGVHFGQEKSVSLWCELRRHRHAWMEDFLTLLCSYPHSIGRGVHGSSWVGFRGKKYLNQLNKVGSGFWPFLPPTRTNPTRTLPGWIGSGLRVGS